MPLSILNRPLLALLLSAPCMSIAVTVALLIAPGISGQTALILCQLWLLTFPFIWHVWVKKSSLRISWPNASDWRMGIASGLLMFVIILVTYGALLRQWISPAHVRQTLQQFVTVNPTTFFLCAGYLILVNALFEEYFWRWFVYSRCREWIGQRAAVVLSAVFFTVHHTIGLSVFTDWRTTLIGSLAVFAAGIIWSESYRRIGSIWSSYISHAIAVIALNIVAWQVLFT